MDSTSDSAPELPGERNRALELVEVPAPSLPIPTEVSRHEVRDLLGCAETLVVRRQRQGETAHHDIVESAGELLVDRMHDLGHDHVAFFAHALAEMRLRLEKCEHVHRPRSIDV